jgi:hypothetical protein
VYRTLDVPFLSIPLVRNMFRSDEWGVTLAMRAESNVGLCVKYPLLFFDFNQHSNGSIHLIKVTNIKFY